MKSSQTIGLTDGMPGCPQARQAYFVICLNGADEKEPNALPYDLRLCGSGQPGNCALIGSYSSVAGAEQDAQAWVTKSRATPPTLRWTGALDSC